MERILLRNLSALLSNHREGLGGAGPLAKVLANEYFLSAIQKPIAVAPIVSALPAVDINRAIIGRLYEAPDQILVANFHVIG